VIISVASFGERVTFFPDIARADDGSGIAPGTLTYPAGAVTESPPTSMRSL
jgi:hypothetical protein